MTVVRRSEAPQQHRSHIHTPSGCVVSSGVMKPKPFFTLNHFTVPVAMQRTDIEPETLAATAVALRAATKARARAAIL